MKNEKVPSNRPVSKEFNLEDRLVSFACVCLEICDLMPKTTAGHNLQYQLSKSGTAAALIYGEVQAAESGADFIHKLKMVLKEIKESRVNLKIIRKKPFLEHAKVEAGYKESVELMAIFLTSIETAKTNNDKLKK